MERDPRGGEAEIASPGYIPSESEIDDLLWVTHGINPRRQMVVPVDKERKEAACLLEPFLKRLVVITTVEKYKKTLSGERDRSMRRVLMEERRISYDK